MAYEKNLAVLKQWVENRTFTGKHTNLREEFAACKTEPERVNILRHVFNDCIAEFETIPLWPKGQVPNWRPEYELQNEPQIAFFPAEGGGKHGCILVAPGGGYETKVSGTEGYPIINRYTKAGFHCALLDYRLKPYSVFTALMDAHRAVRMLRYLADELEIIPDKIGMNGGSAGGNLTCLTAVHYDEGDPDAADPVERCSSKINAAIVMYGAGTAVAYPGSMANTGRKLTDEPEVPREKKQDGPLPPCFVEKELHEKLYYLSAEKWVTPDTCPFFLWQSSDRDDPRNLFTFAKELVDAGVRIEVHIYPFGPHGLALADGIGHMPRNDHVAHWSEQAIEWLKLYQF